MVEARSHCRDGCTAGALLLALALLVFPTRARCHTVTISANWQTYHGGARGWWALQNAWGAKSLLNGRDYTQTITADPSTFPNATVITWAWPDRNNPSNTWGYPEVIYGSQNGTWKSPDGDGPEPVRLRNLTALSGTYAVSLSGETDQFDVLWETHLTAAPDQASSVEFGFLVHAPPYVRSWFADLPVRYSYDDAGLDATIAVTENGSQPYILVLPRGGDMLSGTVDLKCIFDFLIKRRVLTGDEYIGGFELGAEPRKGHGSVTIKTIGYDWNGTNVGDTAVSPRRFMKIGRGAHPNDQ